MLATRRPARSATAAIRRAESTGPTSDAVGSQWRRASRLVLFGRGPPPCEQGVVTAPQPRSIRRSLGSGFAVGDHHADQIAGGGGEDLATAVRRYPIYRRPAAGRRFSSLTLGGSGAKADGDSRPGSLRESTILAAASRDTAVARGRSRAHTPGSAASAGPWAALGTRLVAIDTSGPQSPRHRRPSGVRVGRSRSRGAIRKHALQQRPLHSRGLHGSGPDPSLRVCASRRDGSLAETSREF